jgi:hypothetical protein
MSPAGATLTPTAAVQIGMDLHSPAQPFCQNYIPRYPSCSNRLRRMETWHVPRTSGQLSKLRFEPSAPACGSFIQCSPSDCGFTQILCLFLQGGDFTSASRLVRGRHVSHNAHARLSAWPTTPRRRQFDDFKTCRISLPRAGTVRDTGHREQVLDRLAIGIRVRTAVVVDTRGSDHHEARAIRRRDFPDQRARARCDADRFEARRNGRRLLNEQRAAVGAPSRSSETMYGPDA